MAQFAHLFQDSVNALFGEYRGKPMEDTTEIAGALSGLPAEDWRVILRVVADICRLFVSSAKCLKKRRRSVKSSPRSTRSALEKLKPKAPTAKNVKIPVCVLGALSTLAQFANGPPTAGLFSLAMPTPFHL
ncbi:hypothetical protein [Paraburkholderia sediminicola]|uniref:hypothetical protein n=1 Tax=Paraburkholderia sediminicola TaxID=458836 RepID=UPI0038B97EED